MTLQAASQSTGIRRSTWRAQRPERWPGIPLKRCLLLWGLAWLAVPASAGVAGEDLVTGWREQFTLEVDHRLDVPLVDQQEYIGLLQKALADASLTDLAAQAFVLVDRSPRVQAAFVIVSTAAGAWQWLGATAVSTGRIGTFDYFLTPLGVYSHSLDNPDYRSEGTQNENHIRGYGRRGMRVFDFGWRVAERGWGAGGTSEMRLQMHATDPNVLEPRLGNVASKGCVRIPATLNVFLDRHGILDVEYQQALADGDTLWVLNPDRQVIPWPGSYMVIVDSQSALRPSWSPLPGSTEAPKVVPKLVPKLAAPMTTAPLP